MQSIYQTLTTKVLNEIARNLILKVNTGMYIYLVNQLHVLVVIFIVSLPHAIAPSV